MNVAEPFKARIARDSQNGPITALVKHPERLVGRG